MPSYRLLAGGVTVLETFSADDDSLAIERARELSMDLPCEPRTFAARWGYFRLEREDGHGSQLLFAWVPRERDGAVALSVRSHPAGSSGVSREDQIPR